MDRDGDGFRCSQCDPRRDVHEVPAVRRGARKVAAVRKGTRRTHSTSQYPDYSALHERADNTAPPAGRRAIHSQGAEKGTGLGKDRAADGAVGLLEILFENTVELEWPRRSGSAAAAGHGSRGTANEGRRQPAFCKRRRLVPVSLRALPRAPGPLHPQWAAPRLRVGASAVLRDQARELQVGRRADPKAA
jgi:hypothetical protein